MIVKNHEADRYGVSPPKGLSIALVYGPDAGLVQERTEKLLKTVTPDLTDPFNAADLGEAALLADPARLADEAAAISMMGGRRTVRVRGVANGGGLVVEATFLNMASMSKSSPSSASSKAWVVERGLAEASALLGGGGAETPPEVAARRPAAALAALRSRSIICRMRLGMAAKTSSGISSPEVAACR